MQIGMTSTDIQPLGRLINRAVIWYQLEVQTCNVYYTTPIAEQTLWTVNLTLDDFHALDTLINLILNLRMGKVRPFRE